MIGSKDHNPTMGHKIIWFGIFFFEEGGCFSVPPPGFGLFLDYGKEGYQFKIMFWRCIYEKIKLKKG